MPSSWISGCRRPTAPRVSTRPRPSRQSHPSIGVLVLSAHIETHFALELLEAGTTGAGYLLKERVTDIDEVTDALRRVALGGLVLDPSVVALLVGRQTGAQPTRRPDRPGA